VRRRTARRVGVAAAVLAVVGGAAIAAERPNPITDAVADGCERNPTGLYTADSPNWAYVNDRNAPADGPPPPAQYVHGRVGAQLEPSLAVHPTGVDNPFTHRSYDVVTNVDPEPQYEFLLGAGNLSGTGETVNRLHTEWESAAFPRWAWPDRGDRVELIGSWVWDCDHFAGGGERTELHPLRAVVVHKPISFRSPRAEAEAIVYVSTDGTAASVQADCAHRTKHDRAAFKACVRSTTPWQDVNGTYTVFVKAPPRTSRYGTTRLRVVDRGSVGGVRVSARLVGPDGRVTFRIGAPRGRRIVVAKQIFVGWAPLDRAKRPVHLRVSFRSLLVRRAMDPGCPGAREIACGSKQTMRGRQISRPPGEWNVYWNVGGIWGQWDPPVLRPRDGQLVRGRQSVDLYVPRGEPWRLFMYARECDFGSLSMGGPSPLAPCPRSTEVGDPIGDDSAGSAEVRFRSPAAALGRHVVDATTAGSSCPPVNRRGCFRVVFDVKRVP
jgi:hypothetical protein